MNPRLFPIIIFFLGTYCSKVEDGKREKTQIESASPTDGLEGDAIGARTSYGDFGFNLRPYFTSDGEAACKAKARTVWQSGKCVDLVETCQASGGLWDSSQSSCSLLGRVNAAGCAAKKLQWKDGACEIFVASSQENKITFAPEVAVASNQTILATPHTPANTAGATDIDIAGSDREALWNEIFGNPTPIVEDANATQPVATPEPGEGSLATDSNTATAEAQEPEYETPDDPAQDPVVEPTDQPDTTEPEETVEPDGDESGGTSVLLARSCTETDTCEPILLPGSLVSSNRYGYPPSRTNPAIAASDTFLLSVGDTNQFLTAGLAGPSLGLADRYDPLDANAPAQLLQLKYMQDQWQVYSPYWKLCMAIESDGYVTDLATCESVLAANHRLSIQGNQLSSRGLCLGLFSGELRFVQCSEATTLLHFESQMVERAPARELTDLAGSVGDLGSEWYQVLHAGKCLSLGSEGKMLETPCVQGRTDPNQIVTFLRSGENWQMSFLGAPGGCFVATFGGLKIQDPCLNATDVQVVSRPNGVHLATAGEPVCLSVESGEVKKGDCALLRLAPMGWRSRLAELSETQIQELEVSSIWNQQAILQGPTAFQSKSSGRYLCPGEERATLGSCAENPWFVVVYPERRFALTYQGSCLQRDLTMAPCDALELAETDLWRIAEMGMGSVVMQWASKQCITASKEHSLDLKGCKETDADSYFFPRPVLRPYTTLAAEAAVLPMEKEVVQVPTLRVYTREDAARGWEFAGATGEASYCVQPKGKPAAVLCAEESQDSALPGFGTWHAEDAWTGDYESTSAAGWVGYMRLPNRQIYGPIEGTKMADDLDLIPGAACVGDLCSDLGPRILSGTAEQPVLELKVDIEVPAGGSITWGYADCVGADCATTVTSSSLSQLQLDLDGSRKRHHLILRIADASGSTIQRELTLVNQNLIFPGSFGFVGHQVLEGGTVNRAQWDAIRKSDVRVRLEKVTGTFAKVCAYFVEMVRCLDQNLSGNYEFNFGSPELADGSYRLQVGFQDAKEASLGARSLNFILDATAPTVRITEAGGQTWSESEDNVFARSQLVERDGNYFLDATLTILADPNDQKICLLDCSTTTCEEAVCASDIQETITTALSIPVRDLSGVNIHPVRVTDGINQFAFPVQFLIDATAPTIASLAVVRSGGKMTVDPLQVSSLDAGDFANATATDEYLAFDGLPADLRTIKVDLELATTIESEVQVCVLTEGLSARQCLAFPATSSGVWLPIPSGLKEVQLFLADARGNESSQSYWFFAPVGDADKTAEELAAYPKIQFQFLTGVFNASLPGIPAFWPALAADDPRRDWGQLSRLRKKTVLGLAEPRTYLTNAVTGSCLNFESGQLRHGPCLASSLTINADGVLYDGFDCLHASSGVVRTIACDSAIPVTLQLPDGADADLLKVYRGSVAEIPDSTALEIGMHDAVQGGSEHFQHWTPSEIFYARLTLGADVTRICSSIGGCQARDRSKTGGLFFPLRGEQLTFNLLSRYGNIASYTQNLGATLVSWELDGSPLPAKEEILELPVRTGPATFRFGHALGSTIVDSFTVCLELEGARTCSEKEPIATKTLEVNLPVSGRTRMATLQFEVQFETKSGETLTQYDRRRTILDRGVAIEEQGNHVYPTYAGRQLTGLFRLMDGGSTPLQRVWNFTRFNHAPGLNYRHSSVTAGTLTELAPGAAGVVEGNVATLDPNVEGGSAAAYDFDGYLRVDRAGMHAFRLQAGDDATVQFYVGENALAGKGEIASLFLPAGMSRFQVRYASTTAPHTLTLEHRRPGESEFAAIDPARFYRSLEGTLADGEAFLRDFVTGQCLHAIPGDFVTKLDVCAGNNLLKVRFDGDDIQGTKLVAGTPFCLDEGSGLVNHRECSDSPTGSVILPEAPSLDNLELRRFSGLASFAADGRESLEVVDLAGILAPVAPASLILHDSDYFAHAVVRFDPLLANAAGAITCVDVRQPSGSKLFGGCKPLEPSADGVAIPVAQSTAASPLVATWRVYDASLHQIYSHRFEFAVAAEGGANINDFAPTYAPSEPPLKAGATVDFYPELLVDSAVRLESKLPLRPLRTQLCATLGLQSKCSDATDLPADGIQHLELDPPSLGVTALSITQHLSDRKRPEAATFKLTVSGFLDYKDLVSDLFSMRSILPKSSDQDVVLGESVLEINGTTLVFGESGLEARSGTVADPAEKRFAFDKNSDGSGFRIKHEDSNRCLARSGSGFILVSCSDPSAADFQYNQTTNQFVLRSGGAATGDCLSVADDGTVGVITCLSGGSADGSTVALVTQDSPAWNLSLSRVDGSTPEVTGSNVFPIELGNLHGLTLPRVATGMVDLKSTARYAVPASFDKGSSTGSVRLCLREPGGLVCSVLTDQTTRLLLPTDGSTGVDLVVMDTGATIREISVNLEPVAALPLTFSASDDPSSGAVPYSDFMEIDLSQLSGSSMPFFLTHGITASGLDVQATVELESGVRRVASSTTGTAATRFAVEPDLGLGLQRVQLSWEVTGEGNTFTQVRPLKFYTRRNADLELAEYHYFNRASSTPVLSGEIRMRRFGSSIQSQDANLLTFDTEPTGADSRVDAFRRGPLPQHGAHLAHFPGAVALGEMDGNAPSFRTRVADLQAVEAPAGASHGYQLDTHLQIEASGDYSFQVSGTGLVSLEVDGNEVVTAVSTPSAAIQLAKGRHPLRLRYIETGSQDVEVQMQVGTGGSFAKISRDQLWADSYGDSGQPLVHSLSGLCVTDLGGPRLQLAPCGASHPLLFRFTAAGKVERVSPSTSGCFSYSSTIEGDCGAAGAATFSTYDTPSEITAVAVVNAAGTGPVALVDKLAGASPLIPSSHLVGAFAGAGDPAGYLSVESDALFRVPVKLTVTGADRICYRLRGDFRCQDFPAGSEGLLWPVDAPEFYAVAISESGHHHSFHTTLEMQGLAGGIGFL